MTKLTSQQRSALAALARRNKNKIDWFGEAFPAQRAFLEDTAKLKAALCTRRAGKSYGVGILALKSAVENPGVKVVVIGKTNTSIRNIYFKDIMNTLLKKFSIKYTLNKTEMTYYLTDSDSEIQFVGADADEDQMNKLLGQKFKLAILDEASMYANIDIGNLVYGVLLPALADLRGQMVMIGTPSDYIDSLYFKVTTMQEPGWSVHKWTALDNPHMTEVIAEEEERMGRTNPKFKETTLYRQHNLGEWVVNKDARVYKYDKDENSKPFEVTKQYQYVLGVDLGYEDDSAFVVGAWSHYDQVLHIVHCEAAPHLNLDQVETRIKTLQRRFNIGVITVDGAGKNFVETLQDRFQISLHRAEKIHKKDFIELMNTDFVMRRINVFHDQCLPLVKEWEKLIWNEDARKKGRWEEAKNCSNHAADAALYMWRWCYNYASMPKDAPLPYEDQIEQIAIDKFERANNSEELAIHDIHSDQFERF